MFPQALNPFSRRAPATPYYYPSYSRPSLLSPFGSSLSFGLTAAGLMIIAHMVAPQLLEQVIPGWQQRFGVIVAVAVVLGFLRSVLRLLLPVASLAFWGVALYALTHAALPGTSLIASSLPSIAASAPAAPQAAAPIRLHGTPALPDSAYFPSPSTSSSSMPIFGSQSGPAGLGALKKLFM